MDAFEQALYGHRVEPTQQLVHHNDRGVQCLSTLYAERLAEVGIEPSVECVGNSYDLAAVELARLEWVVWFNHCQLIELIGDLTPVEKKEIHYQNQEWAQVA